MKKFIILSALFLFSVSAHAINCQGIQILGNASNSYIKDQINDSMGGFSQRINRRKKLVFKEVTSLSFSGCTLTAKAKVSLLRKVRRNAHGSITMKATVTSFNRDRVCLKNIKVTDISLSRTLGIGEGLYKVVANKVIPNNSCFNL